MRGATAALPLHLRIALPAGLAIAARDAAGALRALCLACRPFYLRRFDELASIALDWPGDFSIKMSDDEKGAPKFSIQMSKRCVNREFLAFKCIMSAAIRATIPFTMASSPP